MSTTADILVSIYIDAEALMGDQALTCGPDGATVIALEILAHEASA